MKKLLIATAAMAVVAGAQAQSSVTVYGVVDMNVTANDITGANANGQTGLGYNALSSSRVGFKGTEDLGGGLKAEFQLEGALNPTTGQLGTTSKTIGSTAAANQTSQAAVLFNRESWIGLSSTKLGSIRVGRTDISGAQGLDSTVGQAGNLSDASGNLGADSAGVIRYTSPTFAGFSVQAAYLNASPTTVSSQTSTADATAGEATTGSMKSIYAQYEAGNLGVYAGQTSNKISATYDQKETTYGVKYDFGFAAVGAYQSIREASTADLNTSNGDIKQTIFSVSAPVAALGSGVKAHAVYAKVDSDKAVRSASITAGDKIADGDKTTFALTKALSKRTTAYVAYIDTQYKTQATDNADTKTYAVGVSHNF
jgi:predicted porin